jgi:hypothetical protein
MLREGARSEIVRNTWVTSNIDVTQNVYGKSCWEERVYAFAARCTRQPSCGRLGKRGLLAQASAVGQFPIARVVSSGCTPPWALGVRYKFGTIEGELLSDTK